MRTVNRSSLEVGPLSDPMLYPASQTVDDTSLEAGPLRDPYRGVILVLLLASLLGIVAAIFGGRKLSDPVLLDAAITLGLSAGVLAGIAMAQRARMRPPQVQDAAAQAALPEASPRENGAGGHVRLNLDGLLKQKLNLPRLHPGVEKIASDARNWIADLTPLSRFRIEIALAGFIAIILILRTRLPDARPTPMAAAIGAAMCLIAAGLAATAAHYLASIEPERLPEAPGLLRGARVVCWMLLLAAFSIGLEWFAQWNVLRVAHFCLLLLNVLACYSLLTAHEEPGAKVFPLDLGVLSALGSRPNIVGSLVDSAERQLGIDLRSTWALAVVRHSIEPLVIALFLLGWLSTSLTVVGLQEEGLVERLGVPVGGKPLAPGIHLHFPWPIDRVYRIPVMRVQALGVGHEGEEPGGPENVFWAKEHAANEYTLLLGNGRDLITIDAAVQFRISDPRAWRYHCQNPQDALRAIAYRAVMRNTVNRTLSEALSENVVKLTGRMREMVQHEADAMGLGVEVMTFTVGGMHPPVMVASDYQAVVSAALGKVTAVANAQAFRNETVPAAEASVVESLNTARADGLQALAQAAGQAWSFRTLESQYRAAPQEYVFRRRLEALEKGLLDHSFVLVDSRIQRDGGELWLTQ